MLGLKSLETMNPVRPANTKKLRKSRLRRDAVIVGALAFLSSAKRLYYPPLNLFQCFCFCLLGSANSMDLLSGFHELFMEELFKNVFL